jgi:hypothetical protein
MLLLDGALHEAVAFLSLIGRVRSGGRCRSRYSAVTLALVLALAVGTFAAATVIERHLGWRKVILGYGIASYVACRACMITATG